MASDIITGGTEELRENMISAAVKFLSNPNVQRYSADTKRNFLLNKGLTNTEVHKAFEKCVEMIDLPSVTSELMFFQHTRRSWFRDHVLPFIVYGGCLYGLYWFYKNCIRNILFVDEPKKKTTMQCLEEMKESMDVLSNGIAALRVEVQNSNQQQSTTTMRTQIDNIKSDISSIKGILLNRNQFPALKPRSEPPSIPAWQRQAEATSTEDGERRPRRSHSGGSNDSDGEHTTKNSDSSLEILT